MFKLRKRTVEPPAPVCDHAVMKVRTVFDGQYLGRCRTCDAPLARPVPSQDFTCTVEYLGDRDEDRRIAITNLAGGIAERARNTAWWKAERRMKHQLEASKAARDEDGTYGAYPVCEDCDIEMEEMVVPGHAGIVIACPDCGLMAENDRADDYYEWGMAV